MNPKPTRKYPRISMNFSVELTVGGETRRLRGSVLGGGGMFVSCQHPPPQGSEVTVRFRPAKSLPVITAKGKVCYVVPDRGFAVEFLEISPEERQTLLRLILRKSGGDKRATPRAPLTTQIQCPEFSSLAFCRDVSQGGMFIETKQPPSVGSVVNLRFNLDDQGPIVLARAEVLYQVLKFGAGVRFIDITGEDRKRIGAYVERTASAEPTPQAATP